MADTTSTTGGSVHPIVAAAHDLDAFVRKHADDAERDGTLPAPVVDAFRDTGLMTMLLPRDVGGGGVDLLTAMEAMEIVSRADGSSGWTLMANSSSSSIAYANCGDEAADTIFGASRGQALLAGMLSPGGTCRRVEGGYVGSGSYRFGSGSGHADWMMAGVIVLDGDKPNKLANGMTEVRAMLVPRDRVTMLDNWDVAGLNGTGSYDFEVPEQFVGDDFCIDFASFEPRRGGRLFEVSVFGLAALGHGAVALGIAARALEEVARATAAKKRLGYREGVGNHPLFLHDFAHHEAIYRSARSYMREVFGQAQVTLDGGGMLDTEIRARFRQALTYVHRVTETVVEWCYRWAGTEALRNPHPLGRCLRDIHGATQHLFVDPLSYVDAAPALVESWRARES